MAIKNEVGLSTKNVEIDRRSVEASQSEELRRRILSTLTVDDIVCFTKSHHQPFAVCAVDQTISDARRQMSTKRKRTMKEDKEDHRDF